MDNPSYVAISAASMMRRNMNIVANNVANMNTAGFKAERPVFEEYVHQSAGGKPIPGGSNVSFALDKGSYLDVAQGGLNRTDNPLDVALQGEGWFAYRMENGDTAFGRDGRFTIDNLGNLVTMAGHQVLDDGGAPIAIPLDAGEVSISADGVVADSQGNGIATLGAFSVPDIQGYQRVGGGMFAVPEELGVRLTQALDTKFSQGFVEQSNVNSIAEMTRMMEVQRSYERAVKMTEQFGELRSNLLGRLSRV